MNPKLQKLRAELEKNTEKIEKLQSRNTELKKQILLPHTLRCIVAQNDGQSK